MDSGGCIIITIIAVILSQALQHEVIAFCHAKIRPCLRQREGDRASSRASDCVAWEAANGAMLLHNWAQDRGSLAPLCTCGLARTRFSRVEG